MSITPQFNMVRWFLLLSLVCVGLVGTGTSVLLSRFLTERMLSRDAEMSRDLFQGIIAFQGAARFFDGRAPAGDDLQDFFSGIGQLPDVIRANVYSPDKRLIWSSHPALAGQHFEDNEELDEALKGELSIETGVTGRESHPKAEHQFLGRGEAVEFVENYLPIRDAASERVVGVVEVYRVPRALFQAIGEGRRLIWTAMAIGGLFLYLCLFGIVRRADLVIRTQQERLVESETLAVLGEMAGAVAHGIRNPLASIRSSAELMQMNAEVPARQPGRDIVTEVDRLERWIRDLLTYSQPEHGVVEAVNVRKLLEESLAAHAREIDRRQIRMTLECPPGLPPIEADFSLLSQALISLLSNALEALPDNGGLVVRAALDAKSRVIHINIVDGGAGIPGHQMAHIFRPFYTTKQKGLGIGLPLVRRIVRRFRGSIEISSEPGKGTSVKLSLPVRG